MSILLECSSCENQLELEDTYGGKTIECPSCGAPNKVPTPEFYHAYVSAVALLDDTDPAHRADGYRQLAKLGNAAVVPLLMGGLEETDFEGFYACASGLLAIEPSGWNAMTAAIDAGTLKLSRIIPALERASAVNTARFLNDFVGREACKEQFVAEIIPAFARLKRPEALEAIEKLNTRFPHFTLMLRNAKAKIENAGGATPGDGMPGGARKGCLLAALLTLLGM